MTIESKKAKARKKALIKLLESILYQTHYIGNSYHDVKMLRRMRMEDKISPFNIEDEIKTFCKKNGITINTLNERYHYS